MLDRIGPGASSTSGCGQGFESARFLAPDRKVVGVDYSAEAVGRGAARWAPRACGWRR